MAQWYAQVGGQQYGPISEEEIRSWVASGRVSASDYVWSEGMPNWVTAGSAFPNAQNIPAGMMPPTYSPQTHYLAPHRGTMILVLGILSLVVCGILGIFAWVMGNNDLKQMAAGRMDPSGEGNTKAGKICGMIATILMGVVLGIYILIAIVGIGAATWG